SMIALIAPRRNRLSRRPVLAITAHHVMASQRVKLAIPAPEHNRSPSPVDILDRGFETHVAAAARELRDQVTDQVLLRVNGVDFTTPESAVGQFELHVVTAERARVMLLSSCEQPMRQTVLGQDPDTVRGQEPRARAILYMVTTLSFENETVD